MKKKDTLTDEEITVPTENHITTEPETNEHEVVEESSDTTETVEAEVVNPDANAFSGFSAIADMFNKNSVNDKYSDLFNTALSLFEQNDGDHEGFNNSISFIAENIDNLISQLNKYKKNTEMKIRILFLINVVTWIALLLKVF